MSDPEILDPEGPSPTSPTQSAGATMNAAVEKLLAAVQRGLGRYVARTEVEAVPVTPLAPAGVRFRLEATGRGGPLVVESGPLGTVLVSFGAARSTFLLGADADRVASQIAERVRAVVDEEVIVLEERASERLKRTTVLAVQGGQIVAMMDEGLEPTAHPVEGARLSSFAGTWDRPPSPEEAKQIRRVRGGLVGRLKRKVAASLFDRAAGAVIGAVEKASSQNAGTPGPAPDDGRRRLKG